MTRRELIHWLGLFFGLVLVALFIFEVYYMGLFEWAELLSSLCVMLIAAEGIRYERTKRPSVILTVSFIAFGTGALLVYYLAEPLLVHLICGVFLMVVGAAGTIYVLRRTRSASRPLK